MYKSSLISSVFLFSLADSIAYWSRLSPAAVFFSLVLRGIHLFCCLFILLPSNAVHKNNKALFLKQTKNLFYHFSLKYTHITAISVGQKNIGNYNKDRQNQQSAIAYVTRSNWFAFGWLFLFFFTIIAFQQSVYQCCIRRFFFFLFCFFDFKHCYSRMTFWKKKKKSNCLDFQNYTSFLLPFTIPLQCNDMTVLTRALMTSLNMKHLWTNALSGTCTVHNFLPELHPWGETSCRGFSK